jgi:hypothetical protein
MFKWNFLQINYRLQHIWALSHSSQFDLELNVYEKKKKKLNLTSK